MKSKNKFGPLFVVIAIAMLGSCSKGGDTTSGGGNNGGGGGNSGKDTNCVVSNISQLNSGAGTESSLTVTLNNNFEVTKVVVYDSVRKSINFEASLNYITPDSVRIDQYQYLLLDGNKRIKRFVTRSNLANPAQADQYQVEYTYNNDGYLAAKNLYINGSSKANFHTLYSYSENRLTGCVMTSPSAGGLKVLESTLAYDIGLNTKRWIYTFPDAIEGYPYLTVLNFGKRTNNPLKRVVTKIYNPATGSLIDTWTTNYGNYKVNAQGYITSGEANGDLQQGIASFYGKTNFYYTCK